MNDQIIHPYFHPDLNKQYLKGTVKNHPRFGNDVVSTSKIALKDFEKGVIVTRNTEYKLGRIDNEYLHFLKTLVGFDAFDQVEFDDIEEKYKDIL